MLKGEKLGIWKSFLRARQDAVDAYYKFFRSTGMIRQFVAEGLGISLLLELSVKDLIKKNKIKKISHDLILPEYETQVVYHKNKWCHQAMNEFIDSILKNQLS